MVQTHAETVNEKSVWDVFWGSENHNEYHNGKRMEHMSCFFVVKMRIKTRRFIHLFFTEKDVFFICYSLTFSLEIHCCFHSPFHTPDILTFYFIHSFTHTSAEVVIAALDNNVLLFVLLASSVQNKKKS